MRAGELTHLSSLPSRRHCRGLHGFWGGGGGWGGGRVQHCWGPAEGTRTACEAPASCAVDGLHLIHAIMALVMQNTMSGEGCVSGVWRSSISRLLECRASTGWVCGGSGFSSQTCYYLVHVVTQGGHCCYWLLGCCWAIMVHGTTCTASGLSASGKLHSVLCLNRCADALCDMTHTRVCACVVRMNTT